MTACNETGNASNATADVVRIDGVYYDTKKLAAIHPGGSMMVNMANGSDGTRIFLSYHRRRFPHEKYKSMQVPVENVIFSGSTIDGKLPNFDKYLELCDKVRPLLRPTNGFAPWYYYIKAILWCALVIILDVYAIFTWRPLYLTFIQSFAMAMIGLNVQHDANHGALSHNPKINGLFGLTQDLLGGSRISWIIHHNFLHHIYTNEPGRDLDLNISLLRLHPFIPKRAYYAFQHIYVLFLEAVFGPVHVVSNILYLWRGPSKPQRFLYREWRLSAFVAMIPILRVAFNFLHAPSLFDAFLGSFVQYACGGMYLAFFFLISHNFHGVKKDGTSDDKCFLKVQVETSSNVGGWWLGLLNGGLNYQIEHHLFPRVHHGYYYYIAPTVRAFCAEHNIAYVHFNTVWDNFKSTLMHLAEYGHGLDGKVLHGEKRM